MKILILITCFSLAFCSLQAQNQSTDDLNTYASVTQSIDFEAPPRPQTFTPSEGAITYVNVLPPKFTIDGIYSRAKIEIIEDTLTTIIKHHLNGNTLTSIAIQIESSGKIAIKPLGNIDEAAIVDMRNYLSTYDWDYLSEIMTVDILIDFAAER